MAPIRKGDGTTIAPKGIAEVRKGDGTVIWSAGSAIPDSVTNQLVADDVDTSTLEWPSVESGSVGDALGGPTILESELNGHDVVYYDGVDDAHEWTEIAHPQPSAYAVVVRAIDTPTGRFVNGINERQFLGTRLDQNTDEENYAMWSGSWMEGPAVDTEWHVFVGFYDGAASEFWIDGTEVASGDAGTNSLDGLRTATSQDLSNYDEIEIAEIWTMEAPSQSDLEDASSILLGKYGL